MTPLRSRGSFILSSLPVRHFSTFMVRFAGRTSTMDNREELLDALNGLYLLFQWSYWLMLIFEMELVHFNRFVSDFSRKQPKEIPAVLDQFLKQVAKTGETLWVYSLVNVSPLPPPPPPLAPSLSFLFLILFIYLFIRGVAPFKSQSLTVLWL